MGNKIAPVENCPGEFIFHCPACECAHQIWTKESTSRAFHWDWNGSMDKPTFRDSLRVQSGTVSKPSTCHSMITDGFILFYNDSTHSMKGQTVEIPDF